MNSQIFRKKSVDKVSSPEQLNDYIRVSNPAVWMVLAGIIVLLAGLCVWGILGQLETKLEVAVLSENDEITCYINEADISGVSAGMTVTVEANTCKIKDIPAIPVCVSESMDAYLIKTGNLNIGDWVYEVPLNGTMVDGIYKAEIVTETVSPLSFILN